MGADSIIVVGLGKSKDVKEEQIRQASGTSAKAAEKSRHNKIAIFLDEKDTGKLAKSKKTQTGSPVAAALVEGAQLGLYHFDQYKSLDKDDPPSRINGITVLASSKSKVMLLLNVESSTVTDVNSSL